MDNSEIKVLQYQTCGTCCQLMQVKIQDNKLIDADFYGGCNGNLKGIKNLVIGMNVDDVIAKLQGITCGGKTTSCPDQLAQCLIKYKNESLTNTNIQ